VGQEFLLYKNENKIRNFLFVHKEIKEAIKMARFVSDRMYYIILKGRLVRHSYKRA
jgi:hypothetical protein